MLGAVASLLWAGAVTVLPVGVACPSGDAVAAELDRLGATVALATLGSPEVTVDDTKMRIVLRGRDGSVMGAREVTAPEACHQRASVAAVFIAAWVGEWSTKPLPNLGPPNPATAIAASGTERPRTAVAGWADAGGRLRDSASLRPETTTASAPIPPPAPLLLPAPPPEPPPPPTSSAPPSLSSPSATVVAGHKRAPTVEVAGLAFGTHDGDSGAFGAGVSTAYRVAGALSVAALFETAGERQTRLGTGWADYRTSRLGIGASAQYRSGHFFADAGLFPELTMLTVKGRQLVAARSATTWGAAVDLRGRVGFALGRFAPFLFAGGSRDLRPEYLTLTGGSDSLDNTTLSRWNLNAGAGLAVLLGKNE